MADCGDGWNSTYAIARLLAQEELRPRGCEESLPRGRFLLMGGDMVYPTPSRRNYEKRLLRPYDAAARAADWPEGEEADVFAVPGNHDWYDGLSAFTGIFSTRRPHALGQDNRGRRFGRRFAPQTRSYFALKLPHGSSVSRGRTTKATSASLGIRRPARRACFPIGRPLARWAGGTSGSPS